MPAGWQKEKSSHDRVPRKGTGSEAGIRRGFPREGTRGCGEVIELELSDRNDGGVVYVRG